MTTHPSVGVFLPNVVPAAAPNSLVEWAIRAEERGFAALGVVDRIAYDSTDSLIALAMAAAVTERVELITDVLISPLRETTLLGKQAASIDRASGGRLTLGVGVGIREDDFAVCGADPRTRGARFDQQLTDLTAQWTGDQVGPVPVRPGGPGLLIGGDAGIAAARVAAYGVGWTMMVGTPEQYAEGVATIDAAWTEAGRGGAPRTVAVQYAALGPVGAERARDAITAYYGWLGPDVAGWIASTAATDEETLAKRVAEFGAAGADLVLIAPCTGELAELDRFADAVIG
ncbi:MAG TPA: LLM class flavin-dependent oxidoreductase [Nocardioides sp.]|nr:LLM class flavin-dependent oxidoreductase [Nocardioides sp.]